MYLTYVAIDYLRCGVLCAEYQQYVIDISSVCFLSLVGIFLQQYLK